MAKVVHPIESFDTQANGSVYYKDGIVIDDLRNIGPGIYSSWKYDFANGRQIFRAKSDDKIYERRLVKDLKGNPMWTGWMEIPDAEIHGIQAIAVNSGPLKLPNSDGALKLEITPALLKVFTRDETLEVIDQKMLDYEKSRSDYVVWPGDDPTGKLTPKEVLQREFPTGGYIGTLYIVAKSPTAPDGSYATQWIWNVIRKNPTTGEKTYDWVQVGGGDGTSAYVTFEDLHAHTDDKVVHVTQANKDAWNKVVADFITHNNNASIHVTQANKDTWNVHVADKVIHVTQVDKDKWNAYQTNKANQSDFVDHVNDMVPHITSQERDSWNRKLDEIPGGDRRWIGEANEWHEAFEQVEYDPNTYTYLAYEIPPIQNINSRVFEIVPNFDTTNFPTWSEFFRVLDVAKSTVKGVQLTFKGIDTRGIDCFFHTDEVGRKSPLINSATTYFPVWDIGQREFKKLYLEFLGDIPTSRPTIQGLKVVITYEKAGKIIIGDSVEPVPGKRLQVDVIGRPGSTLLYNGVPVDPAAGTTWDKIHGDIQSNAALMTIIKNQADGKLSLAPATNERWEVTQEDVWVKSLAQTKGQVNYDYGPVRLMDVTAIIPHGGVVVSGLKATVFNPIPGDQQVLNVRFQIEHVSSAETSQGMYFMTDNPKIGRSHILDGFTSDYEWNIPIVYTLGNLETFDKIIAYAVGGPGSALRQANGLTIEAHSITFTGVEVGETGKTLTLHSIPGKKDSIDINGTTLDTYFHERVPTLDWTWPPRVVPAP